MSKAIEAKLDALTAALTAFLSASANRVPLPAPVQSAAPVPLPTTKAKKAKKAKKMATGTPLVRYNPERHGVEMVFNGSIPETLSASLKASGLRFAPSGPHWYSKVKDAEKPDFATRYAAEFARVSGIAATINLS